ncbi:MAG: TatD DNase family protein [Sphingobacteriales bacterium]|jgi:TatD DNase family protein
MIFTDTHTHLYSEDLAEDLKEVMERTLDMGVERIFLPNIDLESVQPMYDLVEAYPQNCFAMMGLHPCSVKDDYKEVLSKLKSELDSKDFVAVGEIGIDLYWDKSTLAIQQDAFRIQIEWAKEKNLPIVIHCRDSYDEITEILEAENDEKLKGIFHCFSGTTAQAERVIALGDFFLGIGGVVTFKNSGLDKEIAPIELKHLVLETDSPYLTPAPHRGKRNESSYIPLIAQKLADIYQVDISKVADITTENSKKIFGC